MSVPSSHELAIAVPDDLCDELWLLARNSTGSIKPLYQQRVKGRDIVSTECFRVHLVCRYDKPYLKPIIPLS